MYTGIEKTEIKPGKNFTSNNKYQFNLLNVSIVRKIFLWKAFPYLFQVFILSALLCFIFYGWGVQVPGGEDEELFAKSNIVCLIIWGIWWPLMIISIVILGRIWCMVCPLELISRIGGKLGQLFNFKKMRINKSIKSGFIIVFIYAIIQLLTSGTGLHYIPAYTAMLLTGLLLFSFIIGFIFNNGTFCKGFCPISMTLNTYSRGSMLSVRPAQENTCIQCEDKNCIRPNANKNIFQTRGCPANIYPPQLKNNKDCILCGQCIKSCNSDNIQLLLRLPFAINDVREKEASWAVTSFIMIDSGFVLSELFEEWPLTDKIFMTVPQLLVKYLSLQNYSGWIEGIWTLFIFPLLLWTFLGAVHKLRSSAERITSSWRQLALRAVIIISSIHMIKSVLRFIEWTKL